MIKNASRYLNFCLNFLVVYKNGLMRKIRLISKFIGSQPEKKKKLQYICCLISQEVKATDNKLRQLIKYNMRKIFVKNSYKKCGGETMPRLRPFSEKRRLTFLWINSLKFYTVYFHCMPSWGILKYTETLQITCKLFKKTKRGLELDSLADFLYDFWRKIFS